MFYELTIKGHVRVPPALFSEDPENAVLKNLNTEYANYVSKELGIIVAVLNVNSVGDGIIIPGDGAAYYETEFKLLTYRPELQEVVLGKVSEITDFGAFVDIGALDGMVHISQTMDDFVSFSKSGVLTGKETRRTLKVGDKCRARIIAISYKEVNNPKIGLTMRQPALGSFNWLEEELKKREAPVEAKEVKEKPKKGRVKK